MNRLVTTRPAGVRPGQLPPAERRGPTRALFLSSDVLGWRVSGRQLVDATAARDDIDAVHVLLSPPLWMRLLNRRVPGVRHHLVHHNRTWQWRIGRWLRGPLDARRFDVIHCNPQAMAFAPLALKASHAFALSMSCDTTDAQFHRELSDVGRTDEADRAAFAAADLILPLSTWCARSLVADYGVDPAKLLLTRPSASVPDRVAARPPRAGRLLRVVFVGNDFVRKGGPRLLAWHQDRWKDRVELHVVSADAANRPPATNVVFHGRLGHAAVLALLDTADLLVHPTTRDMSALVVAEAQARGVPAVASRLAGIPDLLDDGVSGVLVDSGDDSEFIAAAEGLLFDEARHAAASAAAWRFAREHLDSARTYARVIDRIAALVPSPGTAGRGLG